MPSKSELKRQNVMAGRDLMEGVNELDKALKRIDELEAALSPFAQAFDSFARQGSLTRLLSLGQLGRLAADEISGAHFKSASKVMTKSTDNG